MTTGRFSPRTLARRLLMRSAPVRGAVVAGAIAGLISAGIGSRIVMRIIAVLNGDRSGVTTDSSATVGEVSFEGTMGLLVLGTLAGVIGGLLYLGLRRWLWVPGAWRGVAFGAVTLLTVGQILFDTGNVDFQIFEPVLLIVALFSVLFLVNGMILVPLADRIHPEPPYATGERAPKAAAGVIALVCLLGVLLMAETARTMVDDAGTCYSAVGGGRGCAVPDRVFTRDQSRR